MTVTPEEVNSPGRQSAIHNSRWLSVGRCPRVRDTARAIGSNVPYKDPINPELPIRAAIKPLERDASGQPRRAMEASVDVFVGSILGRSPCVDFEVQLVIFVLVLRLIWNIMERQWFNPSPGVPSSADRTNSSIYRTFLSTGGRMCLCACVTSDVSGCGALSCEHNPPNNMTQARLLRVGVGAWNCLDSLLRNSRESKD
ncbi:hypothetical protein FA13DRAFT_1713743 [Coprinellus micaceus]|uniref:Uncharacterized protein n=1 Tax=Coprinellus micaceus TaxID=71717 RepID=A0A4Y7SVD0_COPMI|nr:hypothetical protein FA13DRAFT_1713743 [Coprinellus micaceus]